MASHRNQDHLSTADRRAVLTTGEVAKICHVAPRTVTKWFDSGQLRGYRIPGSRDRRIPLAQLLAFMRAHGLPLDNLDGGICRVLIVDGSPPDGAAEALSASDSYDVHVAANEFEAGVLAEQLSPHVIILNADEAEQAAQVCMNIKRSANLGSARVVAAADKMDAQCRDRLAARGFDGFLAKPYSASELAKAIEEATNLIT